MVKIIILLIVVAICSTVWADIIRPCSFNNYRCIRDNLAANSNCRKSVKGILPNKYLVKEFRFETPYFNSSYIDQNLIARNHDKCYVSEFFINPDTDKIVLAIDCPNLDLESDRVLISHQSKKEDSYYQYHIRAVYPLIRITVNLLGWNNMDLCKSHVYTDVTALPVIQVTPKDLRTSNFLTKDLSLMDIFERENFYYRGYPLIRIFVDTFLCDYDCRPQILKY